MKDLLDMIVSAVTQHIPQSAAWLPATATVALLLFSLVLMLKGAKLAPAMAALAFLGLGGIAGSFVAHAVGTPVWPTIAVLGVIGFAAGLLMFKIWLGVLTAACFIAAGLTGYLARIANPHFSNYSSWNLQMNDTLPLVVLPGAGSAATAATSPGVELGKFWSYLCMVVPSFQPSFWAIVLSTGLAGLVLGMLMPKLARALFAATAGTLLAAAAVLAILKSRWPEGLDQLSSLGSWVWVILGAVWLVSLTYNRLDIRSRRLPVRQPEEDESAAGQAAPSPATAS